VERHAAYMGCKESVRPEDLDKFEGGRWVAEIKEDGEWAVCFIGPDHPRRFYSRTGLAIPTRNGIEALANWPFPEGLELTLVGELQNHTQAATDLYDKTGFRQYHVFDMVSLHGNDTRGLTLRDRRELLTALWKNLGPETTRRFVLVDQWKRDFRHLFNRVEAQGGEGLILKDTTQTYRPTNEDQKVEHWLKVKRVTTVEAIITGFAYGEKTKEIVAFTVAMYRDGVLTPIGKASLQGALRKKRDTFVLDDFVGKVVEIEAFGQFTSGAMRSGFVIRLRPDKAPKDCVLA